MVKELLNFFMMAKEKPKETQDDEMEDVSKSNEIQLLDCFAEFK